MKLVHGVLLFALVANAIANILIKEGMRAKDLDPSNLIATFKAIAFNPIVVVGLLFFGLALGAYSFVLSQVKLSVAYPIMTSAGFLIVVTYSFLVLQENITLIQVGGLAMILGGVWMVATNL